MLIDLDAGLAAILERRMTQYPQHTNRISQLDDPCLRRLYYHRHDWQVQAPPDKGLAGIFATGNILEPVIERICSEIGAASTPPWRIVGSQTATKDRLLERYTISGTVDGFLQVQVDSHWETVGVVDIKTCSPNIYPRLIDFGSLVRYPWTRKWRGQLMLYALANNLGRCYLMLVNKTNLYDLRLIEFPLDLDYAEGLLQKAETINKAVAAGEPPAGVNDPDECPRCPFSSFCAPAVGTGGNLQVVVNDELEAVLERLDELAPATKEAKELERTRDSLLVKGQDVAVGRFLVTWKQGVVRRTAQPASEGVQWRKKIVVGPGTAGDTTT